MQCEKLSDIEGVWRHRHIRQKDTCCSSSIMKTFHYSSAERKRRLLFQLVSWERLVVVASNQRRAHCSNSKLRNRSLPRIKNILSSLVKNEFFSKFMMDRKIQKTNKAKATNIFKGGQKISKIFLGISVAETIGD